MKQHCLYTGPTIRGAGLVYKEVYEVEDSTSWRSLIRIVTPSGSAPLIPAHQASGLDNNVLPLGWTFQIDSLCGYRRQDSESRRRLITEWRVLFLRILFVRRNPAYYNRTT